MSGDLVNLANQLLKQQTFSVLLDAEVVHAEIGKIAIALPQRQDFLQNHGFIHGGVLSYLADNAMTFAGGSIFGPDVLTVEYKINYLRPATESRLVATAEVIQSGKNLAICQCKITSSEGSDDVLLAIAQGTIMKTQ
ncbi:MAG: PaaI family thioesterase [Cellvibrionales bacterium]|nr:PaaI family thioesterase [Cellvibrionales bacterium]